MRLYDSDSDSVDISSQSVAVTADNNSRSHQFTHFLFVNERVTQKKLHSHLADKCDCFIFFTRTPTPWVHGWQRPWTEYKFISFKFYSFICHFTVDDLLMWYFRTLLKRNFRKSLVHNVRMTDNQSTALRHAFTFKYLGVKYQPAFLSLKKSNGEIHEHFMTVCRWKTI